MCCFRTLKRNRMICRCFSGCGNDGWRIATMKGSYKARFQQSRSTTFGKRKVFNTRFDVLSQDVESSKTPSSSARLSCFCESPSLANTEKVASGHGDFQQALKDPDFVKAVRVWNFVSRFVNVKDFKVMVVRFLLVIRIANAMLVTTRVLLRVRSALLDLSLDVSTMLLFNRPVPVRCILRMILRVTTICLDTVVASCGDRGG